MRYAIPETDGKTTWIVNPVDIPTPLPDWAKSPDTFLAKMFPDLKGWVQVADDNVSGAVLQGDGSYLNPPSPTQPQPVQQTIIGQADLTAWLTAIADQVGAKLPPITGK